MNANPKSMTGRDRILAALSGQPTDRLPWAPMMVGDYLATLPGYPTGEDPAAEEEQVRFIVEFYRDIGADVVTYNRPSFSHNRSSSGRVSSQTTQEDGTQHTQVSTPIGSLTWKRTNARGYAFVMEPLLKEPRDFRTYAYVIEDLVPQPSFAMAESYLEVIGDAGIPFPISPAPAIKQFLMGRIMDLNDLVFCLNDRDKDLLHLFEVVHRHNLEVFQIGAKSPLPVFQDGGATSTGMISPAMYREFCVPQIREYCDILHAAGKLKLDHSVGEPIRRILDDIPESGVDGIFGYRPNCEGNATVDEIRNAWQGRVCLMGGIDTDYLARWPAERVAQEAARFIERLRPDDRLVLSTSSAAMPGTPPENFRAISQIVNG